MGIVVPAAAHSLRFRVPSEFVIVVFFFHFFHFLIIGTNFRIGNSHRSLSREKKKKLSELCFSERFIGMS